ncbi:hypothetical protein L7F22_013274 [Adiantum nelumboides]|nr:hypothetical protein [Adiantum nelumboides]
MMQAASRAPEAYKQELDREKQQIARLLKEKNEMELKLKMKDQHVKVQEQQLQNVEEQLSKTQPKLKDMEFQLLNAQHARVIMQEQNKQLGLKLENLENRDDDEEEEEDEDKDDPASTSGHPGPNDDDQGQPGTRPSSRGASNEPPPPPPASQPKPPVSNDTEPEQTHTTGTAGGGQSHTTAALLTYKKHSTALITSDKGKEMAISFADGSISTINPWVNKEFRTKCELPKHLAVIQVLKRVLEIIAINAVKDVKQWDRQLTTDKINSVGLQKKTVKELKAGLVDFRVGMRFWKRHMHVFVKHINALLQLSIEASKILDKDIENLATNEDTYRDIVHAEAIAGEAAQRTRAINMLSQPVSCPPMDFTKEVSENGKKLKRKDSEDSKSCKKLKSSDIDTESHSLDAEDEPLDEFDDVCESNACSTYELLPQDCKKAADIEEDVDLEESATCSSSLARAWQRHKSTLEEFMSQLADNTHSLLEHLKESVARQEAMELKKLAVLKSLQATVEAALQELVKRSSPAKASASPDI